MFFARTPFCELGTSEFRGGYTEPAGKYSCEIMDRLKPALRSDVLDGQVALKQQLGSPAHPAFLNIVDE